MSQEDLRAKNGFDQKQETSAKKQGGVVQRTAKITLPEKLKILLQRLKKSPDKDNPDKDNPDEDNPDKDGRGNNSMSRREFLRMFAFGGLYFAGKSTGLDKIFPKPEKIQPNQLEDPSNPENQELTVDYSVNRWETDGIRSAIFADKVCLLERIPTLSPQSGQPPVLATTESTRHYRNMPQENREFTSRPKFLIIHTMDGQLQSGISQLNNHNIGCQFAVGRNPSTQEIESFQLTTLDKDAINISGTTAGNLNINPPELNNQFWESINIEIEGRPNAVEDEAINKTIELCVKLMNFYNLKISQLIGHMEVPNNGKSDPGNNVLKQIRTEVYVRLLEMRRYDLIDIWNESNLNSYFDTSSNPTGPVRENSNGSAKCWVRPENFVDWDEIRRFLNDNPLINRQVGLYRNGALSINVSENVNNIDVREIYMGFPSDYLQWLRMPNKPLYQESHNEAFNNQEANFILNVVRFIAETNNLNGVQFPLSYQDARDLALLFRETNPYQMRDNPLSEAIVVFMTSNDSSSKANAWATICDNFNQRYGRNID